MKRPRFSVLLLILIFSVPLACAVRPDAKAVPSPDAAPSQKVRIVPEDYPTIQSALNAARPGDVVIIRPGTYAENLIWPDTPAVKLVSTAGPDSTILHGQGRGSVIRIEPSSGAIDASTLVQGFTITGGGGVAYGGGLFVRNASPTLLDLVVTGNAASEEGGGIYLADGADVMIRNLVVRRNQAEGSGGGFRSEGSEPLIINAEIVENRSRSGKGGGIYTNKGQSFWINSRSLGNQSE